MDKGEIKKILGLTQEEMAMVLGVARGQWTMFKSGNRDLPPAAKLKLSALLQKVQNEKGEPEELRSFFADEEQKTKTALETDELKTETRLRRIKNEMEIIESNRAESFAALRTVSQLKRSDEANEGLILIIRDRALKTLGKYSRHSLEQLKSKQTSLEQLQLEIQEKIRAAGGEVQFQKKG